MKVIGVCGIKFSGKDTFANIVGDVLSYKVVPLSEKLKKVCSKAFNISLDNFIDQNKKELEIVLDDQTFVKGVYEILKLYNIPTQDEKVLKIALDFINNFKGKINTPRKILQNVGTELLRTIDDEIHLKQIPINDTSLKGIIIPDIRFINEYEFFKKNSDFIFCYIDRDLAKEKSSSDNHSSEHYWRYLNKVADYVIDNNGSLEDFIKNSKQFALNVVK